MNNVVKLQFKCGHKAPADCKPDEDYIGLVGLDIANRITAFRMQNAAKDGFCPNCQQHSKEKD